MYLYAWFPVLPSGSGGVGRGGWGGEDWQRPFVERPQTRLNEVVGTLM